VNQDYTIVPVARLFFVSYGADDNIELFRVNLTSGAVTNVTEGERLSQLPLQSDYKLISDFFGTVNVETMDYDSSTGLVYGLGLTVPQNKTL
jgi:hypothetical protein